MPGDQKGDHPEGRLSVARTPDNRTGAALECYFIDDRSSSHCLFKTTHGARSDARLARRSGEEERTWVGRRCVHRALRFCSATLPLNQMLQPTPEGGAALVIAANELLTHVDTSDLVSCL
jgi:hypothetical protein